MSLDIDDFTFIAHAQKRQSERFQRPEICVRDTVLCLCFAMQRKEAGTTGELGELAV